MKTKCPRILQTTEAGLNEHFKAERRSVAGYLPASERRGMGSDLLPVHMAVKSPVVGYPSLTIGEARALAGELLAAADYAEQQEGA